MLDYSEILSVLYTKEQAEDFMAQLDFLAGKIFNKNTNMSKLINEIFAQEIKEKLELILEKNNINLSEFSSAQPFLRNLKQAVKSLPVVGLTLAFEPQEELIKKISSWLSLSLPTHTLINLSVKPEILAGAIIEYQGRYRDYSITNNQ